MLVFPLTSLLPAINTFTTQFTSTISRYAVILRAAETGSLTHIWFATKAVTTGCTVKIRVETVLGLNPTGTLWDMDTEGTQVIADGDDDTWFRVELTSPADLARHEEYAIVVQLDSGSPNLLLSLFNRNVGVNGRPWGRLWNGSIWSNAANITAVHEYADGDYIFVPGMIPGLVTTIPLTGISTPDEVGNRFRVANDLTLEGFYYAQINSPGITVYLYTDGGMLIEEAVVGGLGMDVPNFTPFENPVSITAGTWYRLTMMPLSSETAVKATAPNADLHALMPNGANFQWCERTDGGAFTDLATAQHLNLYPAFNGDGWVNGGIVPPNSGGTRVYIAMG